MQVSKLSLNGKSEDRQKSRKYDNKTRCVCDSRPLKPTLLGSVRHRKQDFCLAYMAEWLARWRLTARRVGSRGF